MATITVIQALASAKAKKQTLDSATGSTNSSKLSDAESCAIHGGRPSLATASNSNKKREDGRAHAASLTAENGNQKGGGKSGGSGVESPSNFGACVGKKKKTEKETIRDPMPPVEELPRQAESVRVAVGTKRRRGRPLKSEESPPRPPKRTLKGRPPGSIGIRPRKKRDPPKPKEDPIKSLDVITQRRVRCALNRRKKYRNDLDAARGLVKRAEEEIEIAKRNLLAAKRSAGEAERKSKAGAERDAEDLLMEPTPWNKYYNQLLGYCEREGHTNIKRSITAADVKGFSKEAEKELRTLSWWTCRQRMHKRRAELEEYQTFLLERLDLNWDPHQGPGPEKWFKHYEGLKEFMKEHGHTNVPRKDEKLGSWLKTQITQYRNALDGRQPALTEERIKLLNSLRLDWGEKRLVIPWDARFDDLLKYKKRFGYVNIPWQWKEDVPLAQWVNCQRKKYKDQVADGKNNNLTQDQIDRLNKTGFEWNTGGKGRYINEGKKFEKEQADEAHDSSDKEGDMVEEDGHGEAGDAGLALMADTLDEHAHPYYLRGRRRLHNATHQNHEDGHHQAEMPYDASVGRQLMNQLAQSAATYEQQEMNNNQQLPLVHQQPPLVYQQPPSVHQQAPSYGHMYTYHSRNYAV